MSTSSKRKVAPTRIHTTSNGSVKRGAVFYWMSRDQRAVDNWALLHAQEEAIARQAQLAVIFCLVPAFLNATDRHYAFMLGGLKETAATLARKGIPFMLLRGDPGAAIPRYLARVQASLLVTDFDPLRIKVGWRKAVANGITCPLVEVDAHNVVPCRHVSDKQEFAARTIRPKIHRSLPEYLTALPSLRKHPHDWPREAPNAGGTTALDDLDVPGVGLRGTGAVPGTRAAHRCLRDFIDHKLALYDSARNDPTVDGQSNLSPYLHFGQVSAQRVAIEVTGAEARREGKEAFLEELIVRRELSDNFCLFNTDYDNTSGFADWATRTLDEHRADPRSHLYSYDDFEAAQTHDPLWNAAQTEMVKRGKMHGYMRMYWGKKILEWTRSPEEAMETAIRLNDTYQLDGRDPNGYAGVAWCIGGVHDRAWPSHPVYGKIRYMNDNGCRRKFNVDAYIRGNLDSLP